MKKDAMLKQPLFKNIQQAIKQQIDAGCYLPGERIPTEMELAEQFHTTRQTVNKALRDLVLEGIVERFPRSGTFVKERHAPQTSIMEIKDIAKEIEEQGNSYSNELITLEQIPATAEIAMILGVVKDQPIFHSLMVHKANTIPVRLDERYIKPRIVPEYIRQDFQNITPGQYLKQHCPIDKADNTIEALIPDTFLQKYLHITEKEACLVVSRIVISSGEVASFSKLHYPSSRYKLKSVIDHTKK